MNNDEEISKKNKLTDTLISNALFVFLLPIISYILSYGFNWGYNSYFGLPAYLTSYSFTPILNNFASFLIFFLFITFILFSLIFINHITKSTENPIIIFIKKIPTFLFYLLLFIVLISFIISKSLGGIIVIILMLLLHLYLNHNYNKVLKLQDKIKNPSESTYDELINIKNQLTQLKDNVNIPLLNKFLIIAITVSVLLSAFNFMYLFGFYKAANQNAFYTVDNSNIVINTFNENYITVPIYTRGATYHLRSRYKLIPISETTLEFKYFTNLVPNENILSHLLKS